LTILWSTRPADFFQAVRLPPTAHEKAALPKSFGKRRWTGWLV
jgi:hypothetical protein